MAVTLDGSDAGDERYPGEILTGRLHGLKRLDGDDSGPVDEWRECRAETGRRRQTDGQQGIQRALSQTIANVSQTFRHGKRTAIHLTGDFRFEPAGLVVQRPRTQSRSGHEHGSLEQSCVSPKKQNKRKCSPRLVISSCGTAKGSNISQTRRDPNNNLLH